MSDTVTLPDETVITKGENDLFRVEAWGSVEVVDKQSQLIPVDELEKDTPMMMAHEPKVHLGHTDTEVGKLHDVRFTMKKLKDGTMAKAARITYDLYGTRRFHKATRAKVEKGELGMVSVKGFAYQKEYKDSKTGVVEVLHDIEHVTYALCKAGVNPESDAIAINGVEIKKSDDLELIKNQAFLQHVQNYMRDGQSYRQAMETAKTLYSDQLHKTIAKDFEPVVIEKEDEPYLMEKKVVKRGDKWVVVHCHGPDAGKPVPGGEHDTKESAMKHHAAIEANKEYDTMSEELQKKVDELTKAVADANKKVDDLTKERDALVEKMTKKDKEEAVEEEEGGDGEGGEAAKGEPIKKEEIVKAVIDEIAKDENILTGILEKAGFKKATMPQVQMPTQKDMLEAFNKGDKEALIKFYETVQKAREAKLNQNIDDIPSAEQMEKAHQEGK